MPGHPGRSRPQRPQQAVPVPPGGAAGTAERGALPSRLRGEQRPGPSRAKGPPRPIAKRCSSTHAQGPRSAQLPSQPGPAHSPTPPLQPGPPHTPAPPRTAEPPHPAQPGVAAAGPSDLKMAPLTSRRRRCPPGPRRAGHAGSVAGETGGLRHGGPSDRGGLDTSVRPGQLLSLRDRLLQAAEILIPSCRKHPHFSLKTSLNEARD